MNMNDFPLRRSATTAPGWMFVALLLGVCAWLSGCASSPASPSAHEARYVFVYLKTGPESANKTREQSAEVFKGHMANMKRLADEGKLIIAGPFSKPRDKAWRGIFLFDVATVEEAGSLTATDPGMIAGVFVAESHAVTGSPVLRKTSALEKEMLAEQGEKKPAPGEPPSNIRGYVMLTASDAARVSKALAHSSLADKVVYSVRFTDATGGVFVLDAKSMDEVAPVLSEKDAGEFGLDGWYSTASLMKLPRE
jgi:uncharacterized protein YciI